MDLSLPTNRATLGTTNRAGTPNPKLQVERPFNPQEYREQPSSTIWGPGTIWSPASARFIGGSICTFFYWIETSQMKSKNIFGKRRLLVGLVVKVW